MADIVTSRTFQDGERNITAQKLNDIVASSVIQPAFVSAKPSTSTVAPTDNLLILTAAGGTYAKAPFQTIIDSVNANLNTNAAIWSVRLRSFNAVGNPTFEVDQRNVGGTYPNIPDGTFIQDRWKIGKAGTMAVSAGQNSVAAGINLPGTSFSITRSFLRITLTTAEPTLAAGDFLRIAQALEGSQWRELQNDVHSLQLLVRSSVAGLAFGAQLSDPTGAHSLTNLLTIPSANVWTLLTMPNLPIWPAGTFVNTPGNVGYVVGICLASGSTYMSPANGTWQNGNFFGAVGQSNFAASPVNSTFDVCFIQHEPGSACSNPPMDCPFTANLDSCQRYYQKSYDYITGPGAANNNGAPTFYALAYSHPLINVPFKCTMAKVPTVIAYSNSSGAINNVRNLSGSVDLATTGPYFVGDSGFGGFLISAAPAANWQTSFHYTADAGW
jgi:hypothetical protein